MPIQDFTIFVTETGRPISAGYADTDLMDIPAGATMVPYRVDPSKDWIDPVTLQPTERPPVPQEELLAKRREAMRITPRQLFLALTNEGFITGGEAVAAAMTGAMPASIDAVVATLEPAAEVEARVTWARMTEVARNDPLVALIAASQGLSDAELDAFFEAAAAL